MSGDRQFLFLVSSSCRSGSYADPLFATLRLGAEYMHMVWAGAVVGYGNRPGDVLSDEASVAAAGRLFQPSN